METLTEIEKLIKTSSEKSQNFSFDWQPGLSLKRKTINKTVAVTYQKTERITKTVAVPYIKKLNVKTVAVPSLKDKEVLKM